MRSLHIREAKHGNWLTGKAVTIFPPIVEKRWQGFHKIATKDEQMQHPKKLNIRQKLAAQFLATGLNRDQVAKRIGCDPATITRWRSTPIFQQYLENLVQRDEADSVQLLRALRFKAVTRLSGLLDATGGAVALRAVEVVLKQAPVIDTQEVSNSAWQQMQDELERILESADDKSP